MTAFGAALRHLGLRSGELRVVAAALVLAVAAVSSIGFFTDRVQRALGARATDLIGAELLLASTSPIPDAVLARADAIGLRRVALTEFPSVALAGEDHSSLVAVKVVEDGYPLRGEVQLSDTVGGAVRVANGSVPAGEFWVESCLLSELELDVGERMQLGELDFPITAIIHYESDRGGSLFQVAPRVMFDRQHLADSGLVGPGSRVRNALQLSGEADAVAAMRSWLEERDEPGLRVHGVADARPEVRQALDRIGRFLGLAAMLTVLVAGAAVTVSLQGLVQRESDTAAIKRCFGASQREVMGELLRRVGGVGLLASVVGLAVGFVMQALIASAIGQWFDASLPAPGFGPVIAGLATGAITLLGFGLPSLLRIRRVPVIRVLRRELGAPPLSVWLLGGAALGALGLLLLWQAGDPLLAGLVLVAMVLAIGLLALVAIGAAAALRRWRGRLRPGAPFGLAALARRRGAGILQVSAFGLGLLALLLLSVVAGDLLRNWEQELPDDAPNLFLINAQTEQRDPLTERLEALTGEPTTLYPMSRGRLVEMNGEPVDPESYADPEAQRMAAREWNISSMAELRADNTLIAGEWWTDDQLDEALFSIEEGIAEELDIAMGDTLVYQIAGLRYEGVVHNIREVSWDTLRPNFFLVATPGWQAQMPATWMTSVRLPDDERGAGLAALVREFPGVTALDVRAIVAQVGQLLDSGSAAVRYTLVFSLLAGVVVLVAAVQASAGERLREAALGRSLGAGSPALLRAVLSEFAALGALAGALAGTVAVVAGQLISRLVFDVDMPINWLLLIGAPLLCATGVAAAGWWAARSVPRSTPLRVLAGE